MNIPRISGLRTGLGLAIVAGALTLTAPTKAESKIETLQEDKFEYFYEKQTSSPDFKAKLK